MTTAKPQSKLQWLKALRGADLTHAEFRILVIISTYTNAGRKNAFPGFTTIVRESCVDEKTARKALRSLQSKGYLVLLDEGGNQYWRGKANVYGVTTPVAPNKGGNDSRKGGNDSRTRGGLSGGPSGPKIKAFDPSDSSESGSRERAATIPADWKENYEAVEEWLYDTFPYLDGQELSTALGMWGGGSHPRAIANKILADRKTFGPVNA